MSILEKKIDALMRFCVAETDDDRADALTDIREIMKNQPSKPHEDAALNEDLMIRRVLLELGVPDHLLGHKYLMTAIAIAVNNPSAIEAITKELYPQVAKLHQTTTSRAERAIRHAIETAWDRGDPEVLSEYFGNTADSMKGKTTNSEFIARVANIIRMGV